MTVQQRLAPVADLKPELASFNSGSFNFALHWAVWTGDRGEIRRGADVVGIPLVDLVALVIAAQVPIADQLGIGGVPAPDLADDPAPPVPDAPEPPQP